MSSRRLTFALLALAVFVSPRALRGQEIAGTWTTEVPVRMSNTNGVETVDQVATVTITLEQHGAEVHGTWQLSPSADRPNPPARQLRGTIDGTHLVLTDTTEAQIRRGGEAPVTMQMINTLDLTLNGDQLTGTQSARSVDGMVSSSPRPLTATRARR